MYDRLNDLLSLGQHRVWKRMAVKWSGAAAGNTVLDVCCGSGDLAFLLAEAVGPSGQARMPFIFRSVLHAILLLPCIPCTACCVHAGRH